MKIVANKADLNKAYNRMTFLSGEYQDKIKQMNSLLDKIQLCWNGSDSKKFVEKVQMECIKNLEDLNSIIQSYGSYLNSVYETYKKVDKY